MSTDWRMSFDDESSASFDELIAARMDPSEVAAAAIYRAAWRYDSAGSDARSLETYVALARSIPIGADVSPGARRLDEEEVSAVEALFEATRGVLVDRGLMELDLYRGLDADPSWELGDQVRVERRGLTAWTPDFSIAVGHTHAATIGAVISTNAGLDQVAMAFDPSSDGEIVLIGNVDCVVGRLYS